VQAGFCMFLNISHARIESARSCSALLNGNVRLLEYKYKITMLIIKPACLVFISLH
jgi:hypothetical protein